MEKSTGGIPFFCFSRYFHMFTYIRGAAGKRYERDTQAASILFSRKHTYLSVLTTPYPRQSEEIGVPGVLLPYQPLGATRRITTK